MTAEALIRPKRLHQQVVDALGGRIVRGEVSPGEVLPVEEALVANMGVSRTVVREAVKVLAQKNLLEVRTRTGTRVRPTQHWHQLDPDVLRWRFEGRPSSKLVRDVIDLRRIIEPAAAELAATRATAAQVRVLRQAVDDMALPSHVEAHIAADLRFHLGILEAAGNELLLGLRHSIEGALSWAIGLSTRSKDDGLSSLALHRATMEAIAQHQPQAARAAMNAVIDRWAADSERIVRSGRARTPTARVNGRNN